MTSLTDTTQQHLTETWRPSDAQVAMADAVVEHGPLKDQYAYTVHLLWDKAQYVWTTSVRVEHLDGVFTTRAAALAYAEDTAQMRRCSHPDVLIMAGYTVHYGEGDWAVFEAS